MIIRIKNIGFFYHFLLVRFLVCLFVCLQSIWYKSYKFYFVLVLVFRMSSKFCIRVQSSDQGRPLGRAIQSQCPPPDIFYDPRIFILKGSVRDLRPLVRSPPHWCRCTQFAPRYDISKVACFSQTKIIFLNTRIVVSPALLI